ncbi:hypothetical protein NEOLEDRAFT_1173573 [Neolentinus lepideus HHB14362 ss-1]|uniref:NADH dehydrogenase [ubiquinone] iron-sulfur protein 4, mitochondrial n=1 Tax=Neolentinus lepideus HHB14362 ss-1 TaxID=1314782 RepID=A0A165MJZ7_9AGAM|nr:hypothetical protein NEOLEDRAFT_1173573 [Neolentinus lepideus HHB14362 ss-1]
MSMFRSCQRTLARQSHLKSLALSSRTLATESSSVPTETSQGESKEISPIPTKEVVSADVVSGAPEQLRHRVVRIFQPARSTTQSGSAKTNRWRLDWDILPGGARWENPLMGWASSADYMQGTRMSFKSKEDAVHFAEKQGWDYYVRYLSRPRNSQPPVVKKIPPKNYAENYVYKPSKLRIARTK